MKYLKYLLGLAFLCLLAGFLFFATIDIKVPQKEIRVTVSPEIYNNDT